MELVKPKKISNLLDPKMQKKVTKKRQTVFSIGEKRGQNAEFFKKSKIFPEKKSKNRRGGKNAKKKEISAKIHQDPPPTLPQGRRCRLSKIVLPLWIWDTCHIDELSFPSISFFLETGPDNNSNFEMQSTEFCKNFKGWWGQS